MSYFVNLKNANAELARLGGELATVSAERETLKAAIAERDAAAESVRAQFDATLADLTEKLSVANAELVKAKAAQSGFDAKVAAEAEKLAQAKTNSIMGKIGVPPVASGPALPGKPTPSTLTGLARVTAAFAQQINPNK